MSGDIVNLRQARKHRDRRAREGIAAANRVAHGTPKALRTLEDARRALAAQRLEGHRMEEPGPEGSVPAKPGATDDTPA